MSRSIYFFLILLLYISLIPALVFSQEFLSGKVLEVNKEKMEVVIRTEFIQNDETKNKQTILVQPAKDNILPSYDGKPVFPECVITGKWIRIWGHWKEDKQQVLLAHDIRGCAGKGCSDPTGIMSRLKKILGLSMGNTVNNSDGPGESSGGGAGGAGGDGDGGGAGGGGDGAGGGGGGGGGGK